MTHKFLTSHAVRDSQGRFTGRYFLGLDWAGIVETERTLKTWAGIAPAQRKIPRAWALLQLLILVTTLAYYGA